MSESPQEKPVYSNKQKSVRKGLILVYTGDGKGKTTAALGAALRAVGQGLRVIMIQFIKGSWKYGELEASKQLGKQLEIYPMGEGFTWDTQNRERDKQAATQAWSFCKEKIADKDYGMVILDEINYVLDYEYLDVADVVRVLAQKRPDLHIILTGRNAKPEIIQAADLVTEMKEIKHPFKSQGLLAQRGVDY